MKITVKIPDEFDKQIRDMMEKLKLRKSEIIRLALEQFFREHSQSVESPYPKVENLIGIVESGIPDLGTHHRKHLAKRMKREA